MQLSISQLLDQYEHGAITRRQLIGTLVAMVAASGSVVSAVDVQTKGVDHVSIVASDPRRSAEFYKNALGFDVRGPSPDGSFRLSTAQAQRLTIRSPQPYAPAGLLGASPGTVDHFAFAVGPADQNSVAQILAERGVKTYTEPIAFGFHMKDPDGVVVQLMPQ